MVIERFLAFDSEGHEQGAQPISFADLTLRSARISGVNDYYSIDANDEEMPVSALPSWKSEKYVNLATVGNQPDVTLMLGVEPPKRATATESLNACLADEKKLQIFTLGRDLIKIQRRAKEESNRRLRVVVRIASEMNKQAQNAWSGKPELFVDTYRELAKQLRSGSRGEVSPGENYEVLLSFSPLINKNSNIAKLRPYWPGDGYVDLVGCTFYSRAQDHSSDARNNLKSYFNEYKNAGRGYCIDELGCEGEPGEDREKFNGEFMRQTLQWLENLPFQRPLKHVTLFSVKKDWQVDLGTVLA